MEVNSKIEKEITDCIIRIWIPAVRHCGFLKILLQGLKVPKA